MPYVKERSLTATLKARPAAGTELSSLGAPLDALVFTIPWGACIGECRTRRHAQAIQRNRILKRLRPLRRWGRTRARPPADDQADSYMSATHQRTITPPQSATTMRTAATQLSMHVSRAASRLLTRSATRPRGL